MDFYFNRVRYYTSIYIDFMFLHVFVHIKYRLVTVQVRTLTSVRIITHCVSVKVLVMTR
jgi:hypothetical protein